MLNMQTIAGINPVSSRTKALGTICSVGFSVAHRVNTENSSGVNEKVTNWHAW